MLYLMNDALARDEQAASDACTLMDAWIVRKDKKRYRKATDFIKLQASILQSIALLQEAELSDPV